MDLKLSPEVIARLKRIGNATLVNDDTFSKLVECCGSTITQSELSSDITSLCTGSAKGDLLKEAHGALLSLIVEAVRHDFASEPLHLFLEKKMNWPKARCLKLCGEYSNNFPKIRAVLSSVGFHPPHIVDVQWHLNQCIKSSSNEHSSAPLVSIQLDTEGLEGSHGQSSVKFMCTLPELQDLTSKLKEALRQIERVAQLNHV
ncbi:hypothetical protein ONE63_006022 [Megalurothrips usitatus]|uniref:COMM domain-containing protein 3 n=1 Tax=Megalurothrips usitatus TaxID=439358 RepID=A0AAV7XS33_9NEOP|nr:hypothetical protein ONE63_006022 [Megalurothrips usitatus]